MSTKRERKLDPKVFRPDDDARIIIPKFVLRVGYPKCVDDYLEEVRAKHSTSLDALFREVLGDTHMFSGYFNKPAEPSHWRASVERELAHALAHRRGFGGRERTIHWVEVPELEGEVVRIWSLRNAYTGTYFPPSGDHEDYEPGGLDNMKCHRLANVSVHVMGGRELPEALKGRELEIPIYHLKKLTDEDDERQTQVA